LEPIAKRAAAIVLERIEERAAPSPWLSGAAAAAEYLGWPRERVYKRVRELPHYRDGNRLMFRRDKLDDWLESSYEGPPRPGARGAIRLFPKT
jgi:excisionase family DNA binding protein